MPCIKKKLNFFHLKTVIPVRHMTSIGLSKSTVIRKDHGTVSEKGTQL